MKASALHVTNGDSVIYTFRKAGLTGEHLAWADVLHEGPVPDGLALEQLSAIRAQYLTERGFGSAIKINHQFAKRDALLRRARDFDEVVLWFEHDLYDQLQLLQLLISVEALELPYGHVQLIQSDQYLGMMTADELMALHPKRRSITAALNSAADRAWRAFTAEEPTGLAAFRGAEVPGLPHLRNAIARLCEEFPSFHTGLSRTERQILESIAQGARRNEDIFKRASSREEALFMGDTSFFRFLEDMAIGTAPLVVALDDGYDLTVLGRRVLTGDADWREEAQPRERWVGGVRLTRENDWRWDEARERFVNKSETA
ncbi:MAG: DUF1835 domain-containing protein [Candidatus Eremiobacteraeota bacterium]|nr:DUF1835 domain-containing protein [Candidatus Eremiobacteraeota bacterium]